MNFRFRCIVWLSVVWTMTFSARAQEFIIRSIESRPDGKISIRHDSDRSKYYILYRGSDVVLVSSAADMALGVEIEGNLTDSLGSGSRAFYRVRAVPLSAPLDTDGDGIDDVWELRFRKPRAALNSADANEDHNGSGTPDLEDSQLPSASFLKSEATVIAVDSETVDVSMQFSKPFVRAATAIVLLGGTAVHGPNGDYTISGFDSSNQSARVAVVGQTATFSITLRDASGIGPDRYLLLSILEPATNAMARYRTSQQEPGTFRLRITEGDRGLFAGTLEFTNQNSIGAQTVRMAVRTGAGGSATTYFDATESSLFREPFSLPAQLTSAGDIAAFLGPASGQSISSALARTLKWTLQCDAPLRTGDALDIPVTLGISGLTASGDSLVAQGRMRLVRITAAD